MPLFWFVLSFECSLSCMSSTIIHLEECLLLASVEFSEVWQQQGRIIELTAPYQSKLTLQFIFSQFMQLCMHLILHKFDHFNISDIYFTTAAPMLIRWYCIGNPPGAIDILPHTHTLFTSCQSVCRHCRTPLDCRGSEVNCIWSTLML